MVFGPQYAGVYDALYKDKDYVAEARFVRRQLHGLVPSVGGSLLDLGCGTGLHAVELAKAGYAVTGLDRSPDMVARADTRRGALPTDVAGRLAFKVGDMCGADEHRRFDAVLSLFHVICYMTDDAMLSAALATVRRHLEPGGAFLFDFWHEDAVLSQPPEVRERVIDVDGRRIKRTTTPLWEPEKSLVHITYDLRDEAGSAPAEQETHTIRYFARPELEAHLQRAGLSVVRFGEWLTDAPPSAQSFGVYCLATAV